MGRRPNPQRKHDLLDEIVVYLGRPGIGDLSLRPLAKCLGTSTYTLTYQFGSKDQLVADAVRHALAASQSVAELAAEAGARPPELVRRLWSWCTSPETSASFACCSRRRPSPTASPRCSVTSASRWCPRAWAS